MTLTHNGVFFILYYHCVKGFKYVRLDHNRSDAGVLSAEPSWGFSLHRSAEQTALMRTQIPSCCIDLQNRCIGEGKSMRAKRPPSTGWPTGDLDKKNWRTSDCWTLQWGKRPHYHSVSCASNYLSVFLSPDSEHLQGRSYSCSD